ncbi:MAG TPA: methyl-accepting chemotaxis protein [Woeseiaceae bacterium]|nr:methyl-accepting chemotaxis protein [Woeseiaceae bacterium]
MANKPDIRLDREGKRTSAFTVLATLTALVLIAAAGVLYLQYGRGGAASPEVARLSQDISRHAEVLRADREAAATIGSAAVFVDERMPGLLTASDALLETSGSVGVIREFQQRATGLQESLAALAAGEAEPDAAAAIADDLAYLKDVASALAGGDTTLDVAPLPAAQRGTALQPVTAALAEIEPRVTEALAAAENLGNSAASLTALAASANSLQAAIGSNPAFPGAGMLQQPLLPVALVGLALLLLAILAFLHSRSAVFERAAKVQAEQNERNQQAILRLLDELGSLADGDLTVEATVTEDITGAIADSINYAIEKLRELVATINETAIMVASAAKQTESTAGHMARAADTQNREIRASTESIESMAASIEEVSGNAERSSDVARHSVEVAHKGGEAVRRTIDGMNAIRETIQETSKRIKRLGESSQEIGNIVELINDIAEQTNILALNASIQASMAGEAGRGFAVVADEVQRLAERSTNATKQIEVLVRTIQSDTNEAVVSMERSTTDVVGGALLAENAGAALDEIEQVSNQIASLVQNISSSAQQQAGSAADVTRRTAKLKEISDQTGKATTATAAAVSKLSVLASQLRQTVAGFTLPSASFDTSALAPRAKPPRRPATEDQAAG